MLCGPCCACAKIEPQTTIKATRPAPMMSGLRLRVAHRGWMVSIDLDDIPSPLHRVSQTFPIQPRRIGDLLIFQHQDPIAAVLGKE
jgi:hypothetical protein